MKSSQKGIALLIVLWVMTILMVTVFSFSVMTRAETYGTMAFKEGVEKKFFAEAGIERGIMEIIYRSVNQNQTVTLVGKEVWKLDGTAHKVDMGGSGYVVRIIDESGKISLNSLTENSGIIVKNLLINQGVSPDRSLIERKLNLYEIAFSTRALQEAITRVQADWERDLRPLLPQFVAYEDIVGVAQRLIA